MKKILCLLAVVAMVMTVGCAEKKPEDAAKKLVDQLIAKTHKGFELDTSGLNYKVLEQTGDSAKVAVTGDIAVKGEVSLVKRAGRWVLAEQDAIQVAAKNAAMHAAQKPAKSGQKAEEHGMAVHKTEVQPKAEHQAETHGQAEHQTETHGKAEHQAEAASVHK